MKKFIKYFVILWVLINVGLFIGSGNFLIKKDNNVFFPFGKTIHYVYIVKNAIDIKDYDYSEFIVYAIVIPAFLLMILYSKEILDFFNNITRKINNHESKKDPSNLSESFNQQNRSNIMNKQRIAILIAASIGALGTFLPWVHAPIVGSLPGSSGSDGWITFILFVITIGICFIGNRTKTLNLGFLIGAIVPSLLASVIALIKIIDFNSKTSGMGDDNPFAKALTQTVGIGIGLYLIVLAGIAALVAGIFLRKSSESSEPKKEQ